jgi:hypothetical protein
VKHQNLTSEILGYGLEDFLDLSWIMQIVARSVGVKPADESAVYETTIGVVRDLLTLGLATAGDAREDEKGLFEVQPWGLGPLESVKRIEDSWRALPHSPKAGDIAWLELTDAGRAAACK